MSGTHTAVRNRERLVLPGLVALFLAPWLLSWWLFQFTEFGRTGTAGSHGDLVLPPRPLPDAVLIDPADSDRLLHLHGKWSLVYRAGNGCRVDCDYNLYKMRQLRLAMGSDADRVQRVLVVDGAQTSVLSEVQLRNYEGQLLMRASDFRPERRPPNEAIEPALEGDLYLVDPLGNLMISYAPDTPPGGIIKDLKRLLRYSRIG
jgi:hypothetical protein